MTEAPTTTGLSAERERQLGRVIRASTRDGPDWLDARNELVMGNLGLVRHIAKGYLRRGVAYDDLDQWGRVGLIRGAETFDPDQFQVRFSTHAGWWINANIKMAIINEASLIRVPGHVQADLTREAKGRPTLIPARYRAAGRKILDRRPGPLILDGDEIVPARSLDDDDHEVSREVLPELLRYIDDQSRMVLALRFGLDGCREHTFREVGAVIGASREWSRKLESLALDRLRAAADRLYQGGV